VIGQRPALCPGRGDRNLERQVMGEQLGVCALDHPAGSIARMMSAPSPNPPTMIVATCRTAATASATAFVEAWLEHKFISGSSSGRTR
jgi:hypothetical protein